MSVGVLIRFKSEEKEPVYIPVATEQRYAEHWVAAARTREMEWVPQFQAGAPVPLEDLPAVLEELACLRDHFRHNPYTEPGLSETFISRIEYILETLSSLELDEIEEIFIG